MKTGQLGAALQVKWGRFLGTVPGCSQSVAFTAALALFTTSACGQSSEGEAPKGVRSSYAIVTSLPLFWGEGDFGAALGPVDQRAPIIQKLSEHGDVRPIDAIEARALTGVSVLILAQPRLLAPQELVIIDTWVRRGGRVIAFADPLLNWPSGLAMGDKRRAPPVTLLDPLFTHWGLALEGGSDGKSATRMMGDEQVNTVGAGRWVAKSKHCVVEGDGLVARCVIGLGKATLVADADVLDGRMSTLNLDVVLKLIGRQVSL